MTGELLGLTLEVARDAAALVRDRRRGDVRVAATKSSALDVVTQADRDSELLIRRRIAEVRPDDGFLGEEGEERSGSSRVRWIVDPIDGTVNYLYGLPQYAVSIAAAVDGEVVAGVVIDAAAGVEYTAETVAGPDGGSSVRSVRDGQPIAVRPPADLAECLVATGFHYEREVRDGQALAVARLVPRIRDLRRMGSCALDLCHVAEGTLDAYVEEGVMPWDHAAGGLVARGAGARVEVTVGAAGRDLVICAPDGGFAGFREAVEWAGFLGGSRE